MSVGEIAFGHTIEIAAPDMDLTADLVSELPISDLQASLRFYCDLRGFEVVYDRAKEGFAYLRRGHTELMIDAIGRGCTPAANDTPIEHAFPQRSAFSRLDSRSRHDAGPRGRR